MAACKLKKGDTDNNVHYITGLTFRSDECGITCQGHPLLEKLPIHPVGEGMLWIGNSRGPLFYANSITGKARQLLDENSNLVGFGDQDFDWEKLKTVEHPYDVNHKHVDYGGLGRYNDYRNGVCCLCWMLYPDGRYFADEDGFGMEDNDEENIYCVIDSDLRIVIPWQPMTDEEMAARMREAMLRSLLMRMICNLLKQVETKVPSKGLFDVVYEREEVSSMKIGLSHLILKVTNVGVKGAEDKRYLELGAVNYPSPYGAESVVGYGMTNDIILRLKDNELLDTLIEKVFRLAADIDYEERHPRG